MSESRINRRTLLRNAMAASAAISIPGMLSGELEASQPANGIRKGVQAILMSSWHPNSVARMLRVLKQRNAPTAIEIAFCPWPDGLTLPGSRFSNAKRVIDELVTSGKQVSLVVHLAFHARGRGFDNTIFARAQTFLSDFARDYVSRCRITATPSLEDEGTTADFERWVSQMKLAIPANMRSQIDLRRSNNKSTDVGRLGPHGFRSVTTELHGAFTNAANVYSNDGNLVYFNNGSNNRESAGSLIGGMSPTYSLQDFTRRSNSSACTVNLWRPAYNHLRKMVDRTGNVTYTREGRQLGSDSFDVIEQQVLAGFLGML